MHPSAIDYRNIQARRRIMDAAAALAAALDLPPLEQPSAIERRQPAVAQMRELEHLADLLSHIAGALASSEPKRGKRAAA